jgi:nitronate monooxygenase
VLVTLATSFTELVGCTVPVQSAPMGAISSPDLVAAVTAAGGMGMTALHLAPPDVVASYLDDLVGGVEGPVGMNFLLPVMEKDSIGAAAERVRVVDFYHGRPAAELVATVHEAGALAGWQVVSTEEARLAVDAGCDMLIVRGIEGGGRMHGRRGLWPLLAEVLDAVDVPVLAAGGIAGGRLLAAALAAGAAGVRIGTRALATAESGAHPTYKQAVVDAPAEASVLTDAFAVDWPDDVRTSRALESSLAAARAAGEGPVGEVQMGPERVAVPPFHVAPPAADASGNVAAMPLYAGESVGAIDAIEGAGDIVRRMAAEAEDLLRACQPI